MCRVGLSGRRDTQKQFEITNNNNNNSNIPRAARAAANSAAALSPAASTDTYTASSPPNRANYDNGVEKNNFDIFISTKLGYL
jgi:hypothetical protein